MNNKIQDVSLANIYSLKRFADGQSILLSEKKGINIPDIIKIIESVLDITIPGYTPITQVQKYAQDAYTILSATHPIVSKVGNLSRKELDNSPLLKANKPPVVIHG